MYDGVGNDLFTIMNKFRLLNQKYKNFGELTQAEFYILLTIGNIIQEKQTKHQMETGATTTEIVKNLGTSLSAASKLLRGVEEKGYIERAAHEKDRRVTYIFLSDKGRSVLAREEEERAQMVDVIAKKLGKENVLLLRKLMGQVYEYMKEEMEARKKL